MIAGANHELSFSRLLSGPIWEVETTSFVFLLRRDRLVYASATKYASGDTQYDSKARQRGLAGWNAVNQMTNEMDISSSECVVQTNENMSNASGISLNRSKLFINP